MRTHLCVCVCTHATHIVIGMTINRSGFSKRVGDGVADISKTSRAQVGSIF